MDDRLTSPTSSFNAEMAAVPDLIAREADSAAAPWSSASEADLDNQGQLEDDRPNLDQLEHQWTTAREAADRLWSALQRGAVPDEQDMDAIRSYVGGLFDAGHAVGLEGMPSLGAVASHARETQLERSLRGLRGPESLAAAIEELREVASNANGQVATRIERFIRLVNESDPNARILLSRDLRDTSGPPAANLIDAALVGLLTIVGDPSSDVDSGVTDVMVIEPAVEDVATNMLVENLTVGKFELAHELAMATGRGYWASILAEAALCHNSRTASFEALRAVQVPIRLEDLGSLVLHVASLLRVVLFDPDPGTLALLGAVIPALEQFPALSVLAGVAIEISSDTPDGAATAKLRERVEAAHKAEDIATWADKVLKQLPRLSRIFQGRRAWNDGTDTEWPIWRILSLVSSNDVAQVDEVRDLCAPLLKRAGIVEEIEQAEHQARRGWAVRQRPLLDSDKNYLIQQIEEIVRRAMSWLDAQVKATVDDASSEIRERILVSSRILMPQIAAELDYVDGDSWLKAAAYAARTSILTSLSLITRESPEPNPEPLAEMDLDPKIAVAADEEGLVVYVDPVIFEPDNDEDDRPQVDLFDGERPRDTSVQVVEAFDFAELGAGVADDLSDDEADGVPMDSSAAVVELQTSEDRDRSLMTLADEATDPVPDTSEGEVPEDEHVVLESENSWSVAIVREPDELSINSKLPDLLERQSDNGPVNGRIDEYDATPQNEGLGDEDLLVSDEIANEAEVALMQAAINSDEIDGENHICDEGPTYLGDPADDTESRESEQSEIDETTVEADDDEGDDEWLDRIRTKLEQAEPPPQRRRFIGLPTRLPK